MRLLRRRKQSVSLGLLYLGISSLSGWPEESMCTAPTIFHLVESVVFQYLMSLISQLDYKL